MFSVSFTTRLPRSGEVEGIHYRFVSEEEFARLIEAGAFLEWADVFGERYGTPADDVRRALEAGRDVLLEVDLQGARSVKARVPESILVFLRPPSEAELARRLTARGTESGEALEARMGQARLEMAESEWFDEVVVNDDVREAVRQVLAIIEGTSPLNARENPDDRTEHRRPPR
jgi:guanylate kinase